MSDSVAFVASVTSWWWWLSVLGVGMVINLASHYLNPAFEKWRGRRSELVRKRTADKQRMFEIRVRLLVANPTLLVVVSQEIVSDQLSAAVTALIAVLFFVSANWFDSLWVDFPSMVPSFVVLVAQLACNRRRKDAAVGVRARQPLEIHCQGCGSELGTVLGEVLEPVRMLCTFGETHSNSFTTRLPTLQVQP